MILSIIGTVGTRIVWIYGIFPLHRSLFVLFISYPGSWLITIAMQVICFFIRAKTGAGALYVRWKIDKTDFIVYTG